MNHQEVRWQQRFQNFNKTMTHLEQALQIKNPDWLQKAGMIQLFEMSVELAWKMLKDFLEEQGFQDVKSPKASIKKAFEIGIIAQGHEWMRLLEDRNLTVHTYDETKTDEVYQLIEKKYFPMLKELENTFKKKINEP